MCRRAHPRIVQQPRNVTQNGRARAPRAPKSHASCMSTATQLRRARRARPTNSIDCTIHGCAHSLDGEWGTVGKWRRRSGKVGEWKSGTQRPDRLRLQGVEAGAKARRHGASCRLAPHRGCRASPSMTSTCPRRRWASIPLAAQACRGSPQAVYRNHLP